MISQKNSWTVLIMIVILGGILRFWHLGDVPFRADEFLDINATVGYAQTGVWQAWDHNMGDVSTRINPASDERAWVYRWQVAQVFDRFAPTEGVARSVSAVWGIFTIILVFFVATSLTRKREIGLIAAGLFAVSVSAIEIDRTLRMYAMFAPVFLAFSWTVFLTLERIPRKNAILKKLWNIFGIHTGYALIAISLGVLSLHLHALTANIALVLIGFISLMIFVQRAEGREWRNNRYIKLFTLMMLAGIIVTFFVPQMIATFTAGIALWEDHWSYLWHVLRDYAHPLIGAALYSIGVGFLWFSGDDMRRRGVGWIDATVGIVLLVAIFLWSRNVGPQYIFFIQPFIMIGIASGIYHGARYLHTQLHGRHVFAIVITCAIILVPNYGYFFAENNTYRITSRAERPDYRKVFTYVMKHSGENDVLVTRNFRNYYWSGAGLKTYDFGSERSDAVLAAEGKVAKITQSYLEEIVQRHASGWLVLADNDEQFVTKEARAYAVENFERVSHTNVRGPITIWRWDSAKNNK